ncbi:MAG: hypothetical protein ACWA42_03875 [Lutibacter sp.]
MKKNLPSLILVFLLCILVISCNKKQKQQAEKSNAKMQMHNQMMMHNMTFEKDNRIALLVSPQKAKHQLKNMRNHVVAVQTIIDLLSKDEYEKASDVASSKLGLTNEMKMMCSSFNNQKFEQLGLEFHKNADKMAEIFKSKDKNKSLEALSTTMKSCVACHASFKQQISH